MDSLKAQALIQLSLDTQPLDKGARDANKKLLGLIDVKGLTRKLAVGNLLGDALTGGFKGLANMAGDVVGETLDFERGLTRLQIAGGRTAGGMAKLREKINGVSRDTSVSRNELLKGAAAYVRLTGDLDGSETALQTFGDVAVASGSSMEDIASTAAALRQNLKIDPKDFQGAFDVLITQGKAGAIELNELATLMAGVAPTFSKFKGGTGVQGMAQLGAALQVGRQAFGTASETVTGLRAFATAVQRNASKFKKGTVFDVVVGKDGKKRKVLRSFADIIDSIGKSDLARDPEKLQKAFGSDEAQRFFDVISKNRGELGRLTQEAMGSNATERDKAAYLASTAGKLELAMNALKVSVAEAFTPERIEAFVKAAGKLAGWLGQAVGFVDYLGDRMVEWERKQEPIVQRGRKAEVREQTGLIEKHWGSVSRNLSGQEQGELYGASIAGDGAMRAKQEEIIRKRLGGGTDKELEAKLRRENFIREALGGEGNWGSKGMETALLRGNKGIGTAAALGLTDEIVKATGGNRDELIRLQAEAIGKAVSREVAKLNLSVTTSDDATARSNANAPRHRAKKAGGR